MRSDEIDFVIDYFHGATPEFLETMGVDPTRLPAPERMKQLHEQDLAQPIEKRRSFVVLWLLEGKAFGFSSVDKIVFGEEAFMHLHVVDPDSRRAGHGAACVRQSVEIFFDVLRLRRLKCEPNAFNVAPNRTLQKAGFRYVKTHRTVPGSMNFHQAVTQWVLERPAPSAAADANRSVWRVTPLITIVDHRPLLQQRVIDLILSIQRDEFGFDVQVADQPDLLDVEHFYQTGNGAFWVALDGGDVVGTIALRDIGNRRGALRKMFVRASHRGPEHAVAKRLLAKLLAFATERDLREVFLGTTEKFVAAHRFYEKQGFTRIAPEALPATFPRMTLDTRFYRIGIS